MMFLLWVDASLFTPSKRCIKLFQGDIRDLYFLRKAFSNVDTVFHTAAFPSIWGKAKDFYTINVDGTHNVIKACLHSGVQKLVYH